MWCLIVVVFNYAYTGTLVSFLSVPKLKPIISSLEDLPTSSLTLLVPKGTAFEAVFTVRHLQTTYKTVFLNHLMITQEATEGIYKTLGDILRSHAEQLTSEDVGPQRVLNGSSAFIYVSKVIK